MTRLKRPDLQSRRIRLAVRCAPFWSARLAAVSPNLFWASASAPAASSISAISVRPCRAASISSVQPYWFVSRTSPPDWIQARIVARSPRLIRRWRSSNPTGITLRFYLAALDEVEESRQGPRPAPGAHREPGRGSAVPYNFKVATARLTGRKRPDENAACAQERGCAETVNRTATGSCFLQARPHYIDFGKR